MVAASIFMLVVMLLAVAVIVVSSIIALWTRAYGYFWFAFIAVLVGVVALLVFHADTHDHNLAIKAQHAFEKSEHIKILSVEAHDRVMTYRENDQLCKRDYSYIKARNEKYYFFTGNPDCVTIP